MFYARVSGVSDDPVPIELYTGATFLDMKTYVCCNYYTKSSLLPYLHVSGLEDTYPDSTYLSDIPEIVPNEICVGFYLSDFEYFTLDYIGLHHVPNYFDVTHAIVLTPNTVKHRRDDISIFKVYIDQYHEVLAESDI